MASNNAVKILEVSHVKPSSSNSVDESSPELHLPLTFSDIFNLKFPAVQGICFYNPTDSTPTFFNLEILPKLKHSLSLALSHFLPLSGYLTWPPNSVKPIITYNTLDDGIELTVAESSAEFDILYCEVRDAIRSHPYVSELSMSDTKASILAVQITLFPNKGFCIGHTSNHAILDGVSTSIFLNAWAYICKQLVYEKTGNPSTTLPKELTPFFDRTVVQDPEGLDMLYLNYWLGKQSPDSSDPRSLRPMQFPGPLPNLVRATFEFPPEDIRKLRQMVLSQWDDFNVPEGDKNQAKPIHLSTFVLTFAFTLVCMVKAKGLKGNDKVKFGFTADCRARLDPPIQKNYIGNCVATFDVLTEAEALLKENGVVYVAKRLSQMIKGLENGVLRGAKERFPRREPGVRIIRVTGSSRFGMYGADFGWGKPKNVEVTTIDNFEAFSMMESKDESGGVEVGLVLKKDEMKIFCSLFVDGLKT